MNASMERAIVEERKIVERAWGARHVIAAARRVVAIHNSRPAAWSPAADTDEWHGRLAEAVGKLGDDISHHFGPEEP